MHRRLDRDRCGSASATSASSAFGIAVRPAVGPASEIKVPPDATVVDTSGRTMLPGLIETHGHLVVLGHGDYATWFPWIKAHGGDAMQLKVMEIAARQLLMAGVTTTVDLGAPLRPSRRTRG